MNGAKIFNKSLEFSCHRVVFDNVIRLIKIIFDNTIMFNKV